MSQPFLTVSAAGLKAAGVTFSAAEAVACVVLVGEFLEWSSDAPDPAGVILRSDGRIDVPQRAVGPHARVETYARLLHRLLPEAAAIAPAGVPGALRLAVARGLGVLDAPPFASPRDFRAAIERFLTHRPEDLILGLLVRWAEAMGSVPDERPPERRVAGPRVDVLRRMLREADLERFALLNERTSDTTAVVTPDAPLLRFTEPAPMPSPRIAEPHREPTLIRDATPSVPSFVARPEPNVTARVLFAGAAAALVALLIWGAANVQRSSDARDTAASRRAGTSTEGIDRRPAPAPVTVPPTNSRSEGGLVAGREERQNTSRRSVPPSMTAGGALSSDTAAPASEPVTPAVGSDTPDAPTRADGASGGFQLAHVVDGTHHAENVSLSPDGSRVAFDSDRDGVRGVYVAARDGTGVRRVGGSALTVGPAWAPDGRRLAVLRAEDDMPQVRNVWLLDVESGEERRLTNYRYGDISPASWFPDGRRLCYAQGDRVYVMDTESGATRSYDSAAPGRAIAAIAASPDGRHIVFQVENNGGWLMDLHDGSVRRVLEDPTIERLAWSPSGHRLAYYSRQAGHWGVWVMSSRAE